MTGQQLQEVLNQSDAKHFRGSFLLPALHDGLIEMTVPDKPRSSKQRYRLTPKGSEWLKRIGEVRQRRRFAAAKMELSCDDRARVVPTLCSFH